MFKLVFVFLFLAVIATKATAEHKTHPIVGGPFFSEFLEESDDAGVGSCTGKNVMKWNRRSTSKDADKEMTKEVSAKKMKKLDDKKNAVEKESKLTTCESVRVYAEPWMRSHGNRFTVYHRKNRLVQLLKI